MKNKNSNEKESILDELDFEVELIHRDNINVNYILKLLKDLDPKLPSFDKDKEFILSTMDGNPELRDKRELVRKFIEENLPQCGEGTEDGFYEFIENEKERELDELIEKEHLNKDKIYQVVETLEYSNKLQRDELRSAINEQLGFKARRTKMNILQLALRSIVNKFNW